MQFLKRKVGLRWDNVNEDDGLYWNVLGCNLAVMDCNHYCKAPLISGIHETRFTGSE